MWWKTLSRTDAQQPTSGRLVPYLRFTKGRNPQDNQTWFRTTFFGGHGWHNGHFGQNAVETKDVDFIVTIQGRRLGVRTMSVTHDDNRQNNNNTPNTYLHYDNQTAADLRRTNLTGHRVIVGRDASGAYTFTIN